MDGAPVVFSGSWDRVSLWDARTGQLWHWLEGHTGKVRSVGLGEIDDDPVVVSGGRYGTVRLWDARTREQFGVVYASSKDVYTALRSQLLVVCSYDDGFFMLELLLRSR